MNIGDYDQRCTIQTRSGTADAHNHVSPVWINAANRWCRLEDQSGRELYRAQQVDPTVSAVITMREQYPNLSPKDRIKIGDRIFNVKAVLGGSDRTAQRGQRVAVGEEVEVASG